MEGSKRNTSVQHTVYEAHNSLFIIIGCKRCREPQPKCPWCRQRWFAGDIGITLQNFLHSRTIDKEIIQISALNGEFSLCYHFCANFKGHLFRMIYKYTIALISQIERNILIGLLCACTTVCIPDINRLSVFYKRCKTLAKTVDKLTYAKAQLLADIGIAVVAFIISQTLPVSLHESQVTIPGFCNDLAISHIFHVPGILTDFQSQGTAGDSNGFFCLGGSQRQAVFVDFKSRRFLDCTKMMISLHTQYFR